MFSAFVLVLAAALAGCEGAPERVVLRGATMGTTWSVAYGGDAGLAAEAARSLIEEELVVINDVLSTYLPDSEISRLNATAGDTDVLLSERFADVLDSALAWSQATGGAYDVTVGPLVELWGFGAAEFTGAVPGPDAIETARSLVGAQRLIWDANTRRLQRPAGIRIDLSSIAKGYAVDRLSALLAEQGIGSSLVEIGGELRARGERPEGGAWRLAVESPDPAESRFIDALSVVDASVATSGDYRNYFEVEGRRYSHLVDPRTGFPVDHELVSVTVVHKECMVADALATALIVMGLDDALALAEERDLAAHFVTRDGDGLAVHYTEAFRPYRLQEAR
ncbi:MAG: FAD:protein FMN transferase [Pseudomonadota bacterium]